MKKASRKRGPDMRDEYDFSKGLRGKFVARYGNMTGAVVLDPDIASVFPDSKSVNDALRVLVTIARQTSKVPSNKK